MIRPEIYAVAKRYGVAVVPKDVPVRTAPPGMLAAFGNAFSAKERVVWLDRGGAIEEHLHELMHVVTHIPGCNGAFVRENFLLMQVEREVARDVLSRADYRAVVHFQHVTSCSDGDELYAYSTPTPYWLNDVVWRDGYRRAVEVGLLDESHRPTYTQNLRWPPDPVGWYGSWMRQHDVDNPWTLDDDIRERLG